ncbi:MAG: Crp/Fnr family transcriptional regulator [Oscillospiraceae bacterium]|nr:Crp/Fnr family transcriptional regulator [Oscillospiraceae bacterium]
MDKQYLINQLKAFADSYHISIDEDTLSDIISKASFRVVSKGEILSSIGDDTAIAGMVLSGLTRCYYIDHDGNDITRGFAAAGYLCMAEGFFGYAERLCIWEALEETTVMFCKTSEIRRLIRDNVIFKDAWITLLEKALRYKIYRENGFLVENATERYLHFKKQFPELYSKLPQKHIATYLGITPESLSRIKRAMREETVELSRIS